jgi:5-methylcytosine-specific restriction endonuclease McrBC GTP-binding regulatory subunit McrB
MNTADKSIALVDVALRRRFQFEELRPNFAYCKNLTPEMRLVLETLNRRICLRKDRDHQIGHSYFIGVSNEAGFNSIFDKHVIPLLQEYFYNDWEGLRFVLGEKNKAATFIKPLEGCDGAEARTKWQWAADTNSEALNCLHALLSNYQTK